jgi:hypothetical protein
MRRTPLYFIGSYLLLISGCFLVTELPGIPYNVIELFAKHHVYLSIFLLAAVLIWSFGIPVYFGLLLTQRKKSHFISLPFWILAHAAGTWLLLHFTVPTESIYDVVGSPILGWPLKIETLLRFIALFLVPSMSLVGITVIALEVSAFKNHEPSATMLWAIWFVVLLSISYFFVVLQAATNNVIELIADRGSFLGFLSLSGWMLVSFVPGSYLGGVLAGVFRRRALALLFATIGLLLGFALLYIGLEQNVHKYGQTFSALQFLLSPTRNSLVSDTSLVLRYVALETALFVVVCISQYPFWKLINSRLRGNERKFS